MHSLNFEDVFPIARNLARQKALAVIGRCGLAPADQEDIEGQLLLTFYIRFHKFDARRSSIRTFASRVMDREVLSILRHRQACRRRPNLESGLVEEFEDARDSIQVSETPSPEQRQQFQIDVDRAVAPLPKAVRETAAALCWNSVSELSQMMGRSRTTIYDRIHRLRKALRAAGIGPTYFASFGASQ